MTVEPAPTLIETATKFEKRRRRETIRTVIVVQLITLAIITLGILGALWELNRLLDGIREQNEAQLAAIEQSRIADEADAAAQQEILMKLEARIVPKSDINALQRDVLKFRKSARQLRLAVRRLNAVLREAGVAGGG